MTSLRSSRAKNNRSLQLEESEIPLYSPMLGESAEDFSGSGVQIVCGDLFEQVLPVSSFDLLILDPPYNLTKKYASSTFKRQEQDDYRVWFENVLEKLTPTLKPDASIYVCADWRTSAAIYPVLENNFFVRNRITWEREKGRSAKSNWKQCSEDIWFCTVSNDFYFNAEAVKLKRKVLAPYRDSSGKAKDWTKEDNKEAYRLTAASNLWTDISIPFWSMPENTEHPTQKPEKLIAKLILASSTTGSVVLDPFSGSGTTAVVSKKLGRNCLCIEKEKRFSLIGQKRLMGCKEGGSIQGFSDGIFWERNSGK